MHVDCSVSHDVLTSLTVILADLCVCLQRHVCLLCVCVCVCVCVVCVRVYVCLWVWFGHLCVLTATCWVSLELRGSWTDDTVTHVSRKHPVHSAGICNYLLTHTHTHTRRKSNLQLSIYSFLRRWEGRTGLKRQPRQRRFMQLLPFEDSLRYLAGKGEKYESGQKTDPGEPRYTVLKTLFWLFMNWHHRVC